MKKEKVHIVGMHCASCKVLLEDSLSKAKGVKKAEINYGTENLNLEYDEKATNLKDIADLVGNLGEYKLISDQIDNKKSEVENEKMKHIQLLKKRLLITFILTFPFIFIMFNMLIMLLFKKSIIPEIFLQLEIVLADYKVNFFNFLQFVFSSIILFYGGSSFYKSTFSVLKNKVANMDTLVVLGTTTAWFYSSLVIFSAKFSTNFSDKVFFEAAVFIVLFILTGRYLEERARFFTRQSVQKLIQIQAKEATIFQNGVEKKVSIDEIKVADEIVVKAGEKIPVDGKIVQGEAVIDESMISGESIPVKKKNGDEVVGATIVQNGSFHMRATKVGGDTLLAQIIKMVEEAQNSQAPIQRLADKVSGIFVPIVIVIAILTFAFWYWVAPNFSFYSTETSTLSFAIYTMISVLIIACPCALGLATPTAIIVGVGAMARKGILIKNASSIENAYKIKTILLDKTGTITEGKPIVQEVKYFTDKKTADNFTFNLEKKSGHPLAQAILNFITKNESEAETWQVEDFLNIDGVGIQGRIKEKNVMMAKPDVALSFENLPDETRKAIEDFKTKGYTIAVLIVDREVLALYSVADKVKETSQKAVEDLHKKGIKVVMLTGDHKQVAEIIAKKVGIDEVIPNVLPADKEKIVREQKKILWENELVAMVGDGINDAPALARADVGIAMGTGTDIAIESGDVVIVKGSLSKVVEAIDFSDRTMQTIKQNLFWAFGYNVVAIPIAAGLLFPFFGITLSPIIASGAMAFSSVSVVLNSLRLKERG